MSHHSHQLLRKLWGAVTGPRARDFCDNWEEEFLSPEKENLSDFKKQSTSGKAENNALAAD